MRRSAASAMPIPAPTAGPGSAAIEIFGPSCSSNTISALRRERGTRGLDRRTGCICAFTALAPVAHVTTRTERLAGSREENATHVGVGEEPVEQARDRLVHVGVQRVAALRTVERDDPDAVAHLAPNGVGTRVDVGHRAAPRPPVSRFRVLNSDIVPV